MFYAINHLPQKMLTDRFSHFHVNFHRNRSKGKISEPSRYDSFERGNMKMWFGHNFLI